MTTSGPTFNQNEPLGSKTLTSLYASFLLPPPSAEFRRLPQTRVHTPKCSPKLPSTASGNSCAPPPSMLSTSFSSRSSSCPRPSLNAEVFPEAAFHSFGEQMRSSAHNEPARSLQQRSHTPKCSPKLPYTASGNRCVPPPLKFSTYFPLFNLPNNVPLLACLYPCPRGHSQHNSSPRCPAWRRTRCLPRRLSKNGSKDICPVPSQTSSHIGRPKTGRGRR